MTNVGGVSSPKCVALTGADEDNDVTVDVVRAVLEAGRSGLTRGRPGAPAPDSSMIGLDCLCCAAEEPRRSNV